MSKRVFDILFRLKGANKAKGALEGLGGAVGKLVKGSALAGAGVAALSVKLAGDFQSSLKEISTLMGNTTDRDLKNMSKELRNLSAASGLALGSLARAKYDVVSAGFANASESAQILAASTKLAVGGVTSAAAAADLLTTSLNSFGLSSNSANEVSDTLFTTVRLGKTTMDELSVTLGRVLPVANAAGLSLDDVGAATASLTAGGLGTAEATTALRGAIVALTAPTDAAKKKLNEAGKEAKFFEDGSLDLLSTIKQFEGLDPESLRKFIPDINASVAVSSLANNVQGLSDNLEAFADKTGATEKAFTTMTDDFNTQVGMLRNSFQSIFIEIGDIIIDAILPSVKSANEALQNLGAVGFDVVAQRLVENLDNIRNIAVQSFEILAAEIGIVGQKIIRVLPGFLGGSDTKANANIEAYRKEILDRITVIKSEVEGIISSVTAPDPLREIFGNVEDFTLDFPEMPEVKIISDEELEQIDKIVVKIDDASRAFKKMSQEQKSLSDENVKSLQATAKAAALNATSAEDAMERVVRAAFAEAVAKQIAKVITGVPFPFNLAIAAGAGAALTSVFDQGMAQVRKLKFAQYGMDEMVSKPTLIVAGEAGPERVQVTPADRPASQQGGGLTINFLGPVTNREFVRDEIIPEINRVQKLGLA